MESDRRLKPFAVAYNLSTGVNPALLQVQGTSHSPFETTLRHIAAVAHAWRVFLSVDAGP